MKMRHILIVFLSLVCAGVLNAQNKAKADDYDVYLLIGQSNMAGRGYMTEKDKEVFDKAYSYVEQYY